MRALYLHYLYTYDTRLPVYKEYINFNGRPVNSQCGRETSQERLLRKQILALNIRIQRGRHQKQSAAKFQRHFRALIALGGDPQTIQHYEKVLQERFFCFSDAEKIWIRDPSFCVAGSVYWIRGVGFQLFIIITMIRFYGDVDPNLRVAYFLIGCFQK